MRERNRRRRFITTLASAPAIPDYQAKLTTLFGSRLAAYYPMDEASGTVATDVSGKGNHGAYTKVTLGQPGIGDGKTCGLFNGTDSYMYFGQSRATFEAPLIFDEGSAGVWVKVASASVLTDGTHRNAIMAYMDSNVNLGLLIARSSLNNQFRLRGTTPSTNGAFTSAGWAHWMATWSKEGNYSRLYLNGVLVNSTTHPGYTGTNLSLQFGNGTNSWSGWLAHGFYLDYPASDTECAMAGSLEDITPPPPYSADSTYIDLMSSTFGGNLVGHWPMNESGGLMLHDIVGGGDGWYSAVGVTLGQPGMGDGLTSALYDRTVDSSGSTTTATGYDIDEGTIMCWGKAADDSSWVAATGGYLFYVSNQVGNKFGINTWQGNNTIAVYRGTTFDINAAVGGTKEWFHVAYTWSKAANECHLYFDGVEVGTATTCAGGLADPLRVITFGKLQTSQWWGGNIAHAVLLDRPATPAEIAIAGAQLT